MGIPWAQWLFRPYVMTSHIHEEVRVEILPHSFKFINPTWWMTTHTPFRGHQHAWNRSFKCDWRLFSAKKCERVWIMKKKGNLHMIFCQKIQLKVALLYSAVQKISKLYSIEQKILWSRGQHFWCELEFVLILTTFGESWKSVVLLLNFLKLWMWMAPPSELSPWAIQ